MTNQTETRHRNAQGYLVPESLIKPIDLLRDDVVRKAKRSLRGATASRWPLPRCRCSGS